MAIDDEELALELLEDNIRQVPFLQLVASCSSAVEAIKVLENESVDLIFTDIQMPGLTGIQFIQSIPKKSMFILVTAYEKYALEGYNLNVVDYLVKPVALDRFFQACNKAKELFELKNAGSTPGTKPATNPGYFFVSADYSQVKINFEDIIWIEGLKDYAKIHLRNAQHPLVTRTSLKQLEDDLPSADFLRIHKSFIVSRKAVTAIRKTSVFLDKTELPVGEVYRENIEKFVRREW